MTQTNSPTGAELDQAFQAAAAAHAAGDFARAAPIYDMLLTHAPEHPALLMRRGVLARQMGDGPAAARFLTQAALRAPEDAEILSNLGNALADLGDPAARAIHLRAAGFAPDHIGVQLNCAGYLVAAGDAGDAAPMLERLVRAAPGVAMAWGLLGDARKGLCAPEAAIEAMRRALELDPRDADRWHNLGNLLYQQGLFAQSAKAFRAALERRPNHPPTLTNLGLALLWTPEALALHHRALALDPAFLTAEMNRAVHLLRAGDAAQGWRAYEARHRLPDALRRDFSQPRWEGETLGADRPLLLWAEQGNGDLFFMLRYLPAVLKRAGAVILELHPGLRPLAEALPPGLQVIERGDALPDFARHLPTSSLPTVIGDDEVSVPYLSPPPAASARWSTRLAAESRRKVGLVWAGNPNQANDGLRSRRLQDFAPLLRHEGAAFYSLQVGPLGAQSAAFADRLTDLAPALTDFGETAAALAQLDLLISIDTATLNLAGALGVRSWAVVPPNPCWRWRLEGESTPFYPSVRIFRRLTPERGDAEPREAVIDRLDAAFAQWLNEPL